MGPHFQFIQIHQQLQNGVTYDEIIDMGFASLAFSRSDPSVYWNISLPHRIFTPAQLQKIEKEFLQRQRKPTVYIEECEATKRLVGLLELHLYKKGFEDSWQFWSNEKLDETHFGSIKKVSNTEELEVFLDTFNECYKSNDPQNPYGELGEYLGTARDAWNKLGKTDRLQYFIVYKDSKSVAVSTLNSFDGVGYISNVGSLRSVRGMGYGKAATMYCIRESLKRGNSIHALATEAGQYPYDFYKRIGFNHAFTAIGYVKTST